MNYTVEWTSVAENQLADIWAQAPDRAAVTAADAAIHRVLQRHPLTQGTDVSEGLRKLRVPPLTVYYQVNQAQQIVEVQAVTYAP